MRRRITRRITRFDLGWIVAFLEGEGSFSVHTTRNGPRRYVGLQVQAAQVDREPLDRLQSVLGLGKVYGPYGPYRNTRGSAYYVWKTNSSSAAEQVLDLVEPHLSTRRRGQIAAARAKTAQATAERATADRKTAERKTAEHKIRG